MKRNKQSAKVMRKVKNFNIRKESKNFKKMHKKI